MLSYKPFKDESLNKSLNTYGFVIIKKFLNENEIEDLINFFYKNGNENLRKIFTTFATNDSKYKQIIDTKIKATLKNSFENIFASDYFPFWGNFFTKPANAKEMPLHADWQYVNEPHNISLNIWCPLIDTTMENGAFGIVPKSHLVVKDKRGINLSPFFQENAKEIIQQYGQIVELSKGNAIIYDHRLLHFSLPNKTNKDRLATTLVVLKKDAPIVHYAADYEGYPVYKYDINDTSDLYPMLFLKRPSHLHITEKLGVLNPKELNINDFK